MGEDFKKHALHYLFLFIILAFGFFGFWYFSYRPVFQRVVILSTALSYVFWGLVHHRLENNLNYKIVVEYTSLAVLAGALLWVVSGASA